MRDSENFTDSELTEEAGLELVSAELFGPDDVDRVQGVGDTLAESLVLGRREVEGDLTDCNGLGE